MCDECPSPRPFKIITPSYAYEGIIYFTYSVINLIESSLHFSTGSENILRSGLSKKSNKPCITTGDDALCTAKHCLEILSKACFRVLLLTSERQFTSCCNPCCKKKVSHSWCALIRNINCGYLQTCTISWSVCFSLMSQ